MLKIEVKVPELPGLREVARLEEAVRANAAELVMERVRANFLRRGGREYWVAAADSVEVRPGGSHETLVRVKHTGVALHYYGGTVRPRQAKLLALPAAAEMSEYARSVPGLKMVPLSGYPHLRGLLVATEAGTAARKHKNKPAGRTIRRAVYELDVFHICRLFLEFDLWAGMW